MEELQAIETTSGRQFKPWVDADKLQEIVSDPASVTAITSEIASGKQAIAQAINAKGGTASATESFTELAEAVEEIPNFNTYNCEYIEGHYPTNVSEVFELKYIRSINTSKIITLGMNFILKGLLYLETIELPECTTINQNSSNENPSLKRFVCPKCTTANSSSWYLTPFYGCPKMEYIEFGTLTVLGSLTGASNTLDYLRNITIGELTNINLNFSDWTASNVIAEGQSGIDELNSNLQTNLISKLYQGGGKILRLGAALYDVTTQETRDMVTAKGWTLQRG